MSGKFEVSQRKNGEYQFNLKAGNRDWLSRRMNGQVILASEGYTARTACLSGIESVRKHAGSDDNFERRIAKDGSPYFVLKAGNGKIIGHSEMYTSAAARDNGIASVTRHAVDTATVDTTATA